MRLNAPPRDGQANLEVINVLAKALGCSKADLRIVQGQKARQKVVEIQGQPADQTSESFLIKIKSLLGNSTLHQIEQNHVPIWFIVLD